MRVCRAFYGSFGLVLLERWGARDMGADIGLSGQGVSLGGKE